MAVRTPGSWKALGFTIFAVANLGVGVAAWKQASSPLKRPAASARYTILQFAEDGSGPVARTKGVGDFERGELHHTMFLPSGEPFLETMRFGDVTYTRYVARDHSPDAVALGRGVWERNEAVTPEGRAARSALNALVTPSGSLGYLRSVADDVVRVGRERVLGKQTTHYRATVDLGRLGGPTRDFPIEIWVDEDGLVRRYRYHPLGSGETFVWEFYDFGVTVDLLPPPPQAAK